MSSGWQIYYDFLSATTKLLSPKLRWLRFAKMRVAFVSPKSVAIPVRAQVARFIVNNNRETMVRSRRPAAGWSFPVASSPLASFRQNAPRPHAEEHRSASTDACTSRLRGDASRSMRPRAVTVLILRDARTLVRLCGSACACALLRMRTPELAARRRTVRRNSHLTISNSPSRSRGALSAPGVWIVASLTRKRVGGAPRDVRGLSGTPVGRIMCVKDARERAYDPAIHRLRKKLLRRGWTTRNRVYPISGALGAQVGFIRLAWSSPRVTHVGARASRG